jgi:hypothetical protein
MSLKLFNSLILVSVVVGLLAVVFAPIVNNVSAFDPVEDACSTAEARKNSSVCKDNTGDNTLTGKDGILTKAVNILSILIGVAAVIAIIIGGFNFVVSGGDSAKVASARSTILYAIIGLVVAFLAQAIVLFVLSNL